MIIQYSAIKQLSGSWDLTGYVDKYNFNKIYVSRYTYCTQTWIDVSILGFKVIIYLFKQNWDLVFSSYNGSGFQWVKSITIESVYWLNTNTEIMQYVFNS